MTSHHAISGAILLLLSLHMGCKDDTPDPAAETPENAAGAAEAAPEAPEPAETSATPTEAAETEAAEASAKGSEAKDTGAAPAAGDEAGAKEEPASPSPGELAKKRQSERQKRLQDIYALGRSRDGESVQKLIDVMTSDEEPGIRATAIRVLGRERREELLGTVTELATSESLPVKIEAAILLYQWGEKKKALPLLEQLSKEGVALRRAFLTGRKNGKNQYDKKGKKFLRRGLDAENVYTQLDAALGLYEMGDGKKALTVFERVMKTEETFYVRMAALNYLRHLKDDKQVRGIIEIARQDLDDRVKQRATQILAEPSRKGK
jgi:HEAT repeat protein